MGLQVQVLNADTSREINAAFDTFVRDSVPGVGSTLPPPASLPAAVRLNGLSAESGQTCTRGRPSHW